MLSGSHESQHRFLFHSPSHSKTELGLHCNRHHFSRLAWSAAQWSHPPHSRHHTDLPGTAHCLMADIVAASIGYRLLPFHLIRYGTTHDKPLAVLPGPVEALDTAHAASTA